MSETNAWFEGHGLDLSGLAGIAQMDAIPAQAGGWARIARAVIAM